MCIIDANEDDETLCVPFDDNDILIDHDPMALIDHPPTLPEGDNGKSISLLLNIYSFVVLF